MAKLPAVLRTAVDKVDLNTFTSFRRLPLELRRQIWKEAACATSQIINVSVHIESHIYVKKAARKSITNSALLRTCAESRMVALENLHHVFNAWKFSNDGGVLSAPGQVMASSTDIVYCSEYYRPSERTSTTAYLTLHSGSALSKVSRIAFDIGIIWVMSSHYQRLRVIIWTFSAKEIILVDRKSNATASMSNKGLELVELDDISQEYDRRLPVFTGFLGFRPSEETVKKVLGFHMPIIAKADFKMPKFKRMGLTRGGVRI